MTIQRQNLLLEEIKSMSELELQSFFEELSEYIKKNNLVTVVQNSFDLEDLSDRVDELQEELDDMEKERDNALSDLDDLKHNVKEALALLQ